MRFFHVYQMPTLFACLIMLFGLFGCSGKNYHVSVDAERKNTAVEHGTRCIVLPGIDGMEQVDSEYKAYAAQVEQALTEQGFCIVQEPLQAELAVFISYVSVNEQGQELRSLQLEASVVEVREHLPRLGETMWQIKTKSVDSAANMEAAFPFLLAAAKPYLGKSTPHTLEVDIPVDTRQRPTVAFNP